MCCIIKSRGAVLRHWPFKNALFCTLFFLIFGCTPPPSGASENAKQTHSTRNDVPSRQISSDSITGRLPQIAGIPAAILDKAELHLEWSSRLPMGRAKSINRFFIHDRQLYALNDHNLLLALDAEKGTVIWSQVLGPPIFACSSAAFYQDSLLFVVGKTFIQVRRKDGQILQRQELAFPVTTGPARTQDRLFVGSSDKRFYSLRITDGIPLWQNLCEQEPVGTVTVAGNKVYFVTKSNILYVSSLLNRREVWSFQTAGLLPGVVIDGKQCFLPSGDTALYCLDCDTGRLLWKYLAGGSLSELPILTERFAYQPVQHKSLLCLDRNPDKQAGSLRWELENGLCFLAENGSVSYAMTQNRELTLMNNLNGKAVLSFYVQNMDLYVPNSESAMIFLGNKSGVIIALKPNRIEAPSVPAAETAPEVKPPAEPESAEPNE